MIRMLIVGYSFGIRSERRLCEEVHLNLAYRWFCRLVWRMPCRITPPSPRIDMVDFVRAGYSAGCLTRSFAAAWQQVWSRAKASRWTPALWQRMRAVCVASRQARQSDWTNPALNTRAVREYLEALDEEALAEALPRRVSLTDPQSSWTAATGDRPFFAYSTNYLIDTAHGVILDVEATPTNRTAEVESTKMMIERVEERFDLTPERLIGDTAYGAAPMLAWLVQEKGIEPHVPVWDKSERQDGTFSSNDFDWNERPMNTAARKAMHCAATGVPSRTSRTQSRKLTPLSIEQASPTARTCPMKATCCPNTPFAKSIRSIHEAARDVARHIATTPQYQRSRCERKKVEVLFAHLKRILRLDRLSYAVFLVPLTNLLWPRPRKICGAWRN